MLSTLTHRILNSMSFSKTGLYNISKKLQYPENYLSLYKSKFFTCMIFLYLAEIFGDIFKNSEAALRYKQLLPTLLTSVNTIFIQQSGFYPQRYLYTSLDFDPQN